MTDKELDNLRQRVSSLEDRVGAMELSHQLSDSMQTDVTNLRARVDALFAYEEEKRASVETPTYINELLLAVVNALYVTRSQGAYHMAKALEEKYFDGEDMQEIGDRFVMSGELWSANRGGSE